MRKRTKWIVGLAAASVLLAGTSLAVVATTSTVGAGAGPGSQSAAASATPNAVPPVAPPTTAPQATADEVGGAAEQLLASVLPVVTTVADGDVDAVLTSLAAVASPAFLSGIEAERAELEDQGWTRTGEVRIDGVETLAYDATAAPSTATVRACLDSSDVVIHDADGNVVPGGSPRAWNIYTLEQADGAWKIIRQTFADDPAC
ncbi:hypothetical protein [uncultured Microbacterium sp.]|uniref:hypothetical protein n=1 Tax=uncultured Microbacterium sp. TaxID=191216 RepID=UPI0028DBAC44|nr:hypothetical protein [uncultured Microbacterium sp.]